MPGEPHKTSFPEDAFTIKDGFGLDSELDDLNPVRSSYRQLHCQPVLLTGDSHRQLP